MQQPKETQQRGAAQQTSSANKTRPKSTFLSWILNSNPDKKSATPPSANIPNNNNHNSINFDRLGSNNQYLKAKLEVSDDTYKIQSYANAENVHRRPISVVSNSGTMNSVQQVVIPSRRQSHLYTPLHVNEGEEEQGEEATVLYDYKHRSYHTNSQQQQQQLYPAINVIDASLNNSTTTLTRSATWQPSSSSLQIPPSSESLSMLSPPPAVPPHQNYNNNTASVPASGTTENMIPARRTSRNYSQDPEIQARLDALLNSEKTTYLSHMIHNNNSSNTNMYRRSTTPKSRKL